MYATQSKYADVTAGSQLLINGRRFTVTEKTLDGLYVHLNEGEERRYDSDANLHWFSLEEVNDRFADDDDPFTLLH
jgi:hypothetical protein